MGYRRFTDREGNSWEVRDDSEYEWRLEPLSSGSTSRRVRAPGYQKDPFEMSNEELQKLLDSVGPQRSSGSQKSPFVD